MARTNYVMSFTAGGVLHSESIRVAELYVVLRDWREVKDKALSENLLQTRTVSTAERVLREVIARLQKLSLDELIFLLQSSHQEQACMLWVAICRRYYFIYDFALEVLRERFVSLKGDVQPEEFDYFYNRKADMHPELEKITLQTRNKAKQVLFKMMREVNILDAMNRIYPVMLSHSFAQLISKSHREDLLLFPIFEADIKRVVQ